MNPRGLVRFLKTFLFRLGSLRCVRQGAVSFRVFLGFRGLGQFRHMVAIEKIRWRIGFWIVDRCFALIADKDRGLRPGGDWRL